MSTIVAGSAMAPNPNVLQASILAMGGTSTEPQDLRVSTCGDVTGCSHILVFIAGAKTIFLELEKSQARATDVNRLSVWPTDILERVFASRGAIINTSHLKGRKKISTIFFQKVTNMMTLAL